MFATSTTPPYINFFNTADGTIEVKLLTYQCISNSFQLNLPFVYFKNNRIENF